MDQQAIAPNESMQLHELLTFKNLCMTKSVTMSLLISDEELKTILKNDVTTSKQHIKELSGLMQHSYVSSPETT